MIQATSMSGLKRVLAATDFSTRANAALRRAVQIAGEHGAALTVLHVCEAGARDDGRGRQLTLEAEETLHQNLRTLSLPEKSAAAVRVALGKPFVEIIRGAREEMAELVIVGAHGKHFLKDLLLGTTVEKVVRKGDRPVLVVKRASQHRYRRVLVAVDFSEDSRKALELALQLAPRAEFHVLHAYQGFEGRTLDGGFHRVRDHGLSPPIGKRETTRDEVVSAGDR